MYKRQLYSGDGGFNLDFHTIRHHGEEVPLEEHYVTSRSQRTRSVLTFFAQDHASTEMVYANADVTKAEQAIGVIAFAEYWKRVAGADPGLLVFDSKLTTYAMLNELATPDRLWRHFLDTTGKIVVGDDHVRVDLALRTYTPVLIDAGFPELDIPIPWWGGKTLRFGFPPR